MSTEANQGSCSWCRGPVAAKSNANWEVICKDCLKVVRECMAEFGPQQAHVEARRIVQERLADVESDSVHRGEMNDAGWLDESPLVNENDLGPVWQP